MGFVGDIVGGVASAVGSVVSGVGSALGALGPVAPLAALAMGPMGLGAELGMGASMGADWMGASGIIGMDAAATGLSGAGALFADAVGLSTATSGIGQALQGLVASESGGMPTGLSSFTNLLKGGMDIYNALNYGTGQTPTAAQQSADPYSKYRQNAADQLNQLMKNPQMVYGMPGYSFAQQQAAKGIQRQSAATGTSISGGTLASLQQMSSATAQDWFNNYVNQLSIQSGANQSPAAGQQAYQLAQQSQSQAQANRQKALMTGLTELGGSISSMWG